MKLRIKGPSLRLRLTQGEVRALADAGQVQEAVPFGAGVNLTYRLSRDANLKRIHCISPAHVARMVVESLAHKRGFKSRLGRGQTVSA